MKFIKRKFLELNIISDDFPKKSSEAKYDYVESFNSNGYEKKIVENFKEEHLKKNKEELDKVLIDLEEILKYDLIFIFGESGSGKTTLLKEIAKKNNSKFYTLSCFNDEELNMTNKEKTIYLFDSIDEDLNENKMILN
ncbi:MAG: NB-ARC domain-containing protein, partial [Cetobacterium sp.]